MNRLLAISLALAFASVARADQVVVRVPGAETAYDIALEEGRLHFADLVVPELSGPISGVSLRLVGTHQAGSAECPHETIPEDGTLGISLLFDCGHQLTWFQPLSGESVDVYSPMTWYDPFATGCAEDLDLLAGATTTMRVVLGPQLPSGTCILGGILVELSVVEVVLEVDDSVPSRRSAWGSVKALYR